MKGLNIFLAVLIFVLAVTSAVFSFFLFEKRAQLVKGYGYLGKQIEDASKLLDNNSGTNLAAKLTQSALDHGKSQDLPTLLPEFISLTTEIVKERDALATSLASISSTLENRGMSASNFMRLDTYKQSISKLQSYISAYQSRNNNLLASIARSAGQLGANVSVSQLKSSGYANAYKAIDARIAVWKLRDRTFTSRVINIATALGGKSPNLSESAYEKSLNEVLANARKVRSEKDKYFNNWQNAERSIKNLKEVVKNKDSKISELNDLCKRKEQEILRLSKVLGLEVPREPMRDGCKDALDLVKSQQKGVVIDVDDKFGFVVVSLGKATRVQEQFGNRINNVDPQIPQGCTLTVARDMPSGEAEYINKLKLVRLDNNCSIAEPIDKKGGKRIRKGDIVYLADDEIAKIIKNRK